MITITRVLARRLRAVFRRGLCGSSRGPFPPLDFEAGPHGLTIQAVAAETAMAQAL